MTGVADAVAARGGALHLAPGFTDPVHDAQAAFRAVLDAMAHPGRIVRFPQVLAAPPPAPLGTGVAIVALTLCDIDTPVWLDESLAPASAYLAFHCGCPLAFSPADARFALFSQGTAPPPLAAFDLGSDEYPDRSATLIIEAAGITAGAGLRLHGPGIRGEARLGIIGLPAHFWAERSALFELFPRGLDMLFVAGEQLAALPRSTRIAA